MTLQSPTATLIPLFSSSELTGRGYAGLLDRKNRSDMCPRWESESNLRLPDARQAPLSTRPGSPLADSSCCCCFYSHNDVLQVAQRNVSITAHTQHRVRSLADSMCMCVFSNSRNDVPRVAQRYGTIAAHTRRRASVLVVFVVFCMHMYSFAGLIRRTPPPTFSDTSITDRHSDTTIFKLRAHWVRISWSTGSENRSDMCPRWEPNP